MQVLITHGSLARTRTLQLSARQLLVAAAVLCITLLMLSGTVYHFVFLKAAREGWPVVSPIVRLVVRDEIAQRDRFLRDNLDAMARKAGEIQAKLVRLEAMSERVSGLAGLKTEELRPLRRTDAGGKGGPFIDASGLSLETLHAQLDALDEAADWHADIFTFSESHLMRARLDALRLPTTVPVDGPVGSGFGFRSDPFTGRGALHSGLDFPSDAGTAIVASAGGVVLTTEWHSEYGHTIELDHGNGLVTRYAHCLRVLVKPGQVVRQGQPIGEVGTSGRSTGPHLHFEVLVEGVPHDPARFLGADAARFVRR